MSIIMGVLGGIGDAGLQLTRDNAKRWHDEDMQKQQAQLQQDKAEALARFQVNLAAEPANRLAAKARDFAKEEVPVEPEEVKRTSGRDPESKFSKDGETVGLVGYTRDQIAAYKDPAMLAQFDRQMAVDKQAAIDKVKGMTRPRTSQEAMDAAMEDSLIADPQAYAAGKAILGEKYTTVSGDSIVMDRRGKVVYDGSGKKAERESAKQAQDRELAELKEDRKDERAAKDREVDRERIQKQAKDMADSTNRQLQQQYAISLRNDISAKDTAIRELVKSKKGKFGDELKSINEAIKQTQDDRSFMVETQTTFFRDAGLKIPESRSNPTPSPAGTTRVWDQKTGTFK